MPYIWNKHIAVTFDELVPEFYTKGALSANLTRHKNDPYAFNRLQSGGNGRVMLIELESLPAHVITALGERRFHSYQDLIANKTAKIKS